MRRAARKLKVSTERWADYVSSQGLPDTVLPLMVLQTPNTPDPDDVGIALDTIFAEYPELPPSSVRHVLGDHSTQRFGAWEVDWIEPQRVHDESHVRVLVAKTPFQPDGTAREPKCSYRSGRRRTTLTSLSYWGRMVRNPLARRIPGDERLNAVDCILPFFDRTTAVKVVRFLTGGPRVHARREKKAVIDGKSSCRTRTSRTEVWAVWDALPTQTLPQRGARPVKRLVALALALSADGVSVGALGNVEQELSPHPGRVRHAVC